MHHTAVWQHSSNSNIKIVHNSSGHFLWNLPDFSSDDVLSCLWIVFTNSVFQVPPQKIVRWVEILGIEWPGVTGRCELSLFHGKLCLRYSSVLFEKRGTVYCSRNEAPLHFLNRTLDYLRHNSPWDRLTLHQTDNPGPSYSQDVNPPPSPDYFLRGCLKDRVCENNPQTREDIIRKGIRWIPQKMLNRVMDNFNVGVAAVLCVCVCVYSLPP